MPIDSDFFDTDTDIHGKYGQFLWAGDGDVVIPGDRDVVVFVARNGGVIVRDGDVVGPSVGRLEPLGCQLGQRITPRSLWVPKAVWKGTPVVASNVGGIPMQIRDGENGYLLEPKDYDGFADRIVHLLKNPKEGEEIGKKGRETVRNRFLITRLLSDYLTMLNAIMNEQ
jgi:hypothetical protein